MSSDLSTYVWDTILGGVDHDIPGNGGHDCADHVTSAWRIWETVAAVSCISTAFVLSFKLDNKTVALPDKVPKSKFHKFLLLFFIYVNGLQLGYKLCSRQLIYLLNPCHIISGVCVYLLAADPSNPRSLARSVHVRSIHFLQGPILAVIFPVTNTLFMPLELATYWVQHALDIFVPFYLLICHSGYRTSSSLLLRPSEIFFSYTIWVTHFYLVMMPVSLFTLANVGTMLCGAITDPFPASTYRIHGLWHQMAGILLTALIAKGLMVVVEGISGDKKRK